MAYTPIIATVHDRLILLLERHDPTRVVFKVANTSKRADTTRRGLQAKPALKQTADWPQIELRLGRSWEEELLAETFGDEDGDEDGDRQIFMVQTFEIKVVHQAFNVAQNSGDVLQVAKAIRRGGRKLKDPDTPDSGLPYVFGWERVTREVTREIVGGDAREVTRIYWPIRMCVFESEL